MGQVSSFVKNGYYDKLYDSKGNYQYKNDYAHIDGIIEILWRVN